MIIAERVHLKVAEDVIGFFLLILLSVGGIVLSAFLESQIGIWICIALIFLFIILLIVIVSNKKHHNELPKEAILYKNGVFVFIDEDGRKMTFYPNDILDMDYKLKVTHVFTVYYTETKTWNYGRLRIWLNSSSDNYDEQTLLTLKNILEPDRVVDKILFILEQLEEGEA